MKLQDLFEDDWFDDDLESGRDTKNPLPVADNTTLTHIFDIADKIDSKIYNEYKQKTRKDISGGAVGEILKAGRKEYGTVMAIPMNKIIGSESKLDGEHLNALLHNDNPKQTDAYPWLIKFKDKFYVQDGNHRIAAAFARKEPTFTALVIDGEGV